MIRTLVIASVLFAGAALAQTGQTGGSTATGQTGTNGQVESPPPPPLVDAPVQKQQQDAPVMNQNQPPTPPPPGAHLPGAQGQSGYQYSPYGAPLSQPTEPPKEYGLMVTETLFGVLTAAPIVLLPYLFFLKPYIDKRQAGVPVASDEATLYDVLFFVIFAGVPVAVAQTQLGLANGSRYYYSDSWPGYLSGLAAQAAVIGLFYVTNRNEALLLVGSIAFVPIVQMAAINWMKTPRSQLPNGGLGILQHGSDGRWAFATPTPAPLLTRLGDQIHLGVQLPLVSGSF